MLVRARSDKISRKRYANERREADSSVWQSRGTIAMLPVSASYVETKVSSHG